MPNPGQLPRRIHQRIVRFTYASFTGSQTTYTWRSNLGSDEGYVFYVYAVDAAGNRSGDSDIVVARTKKDNSPPAKPIVEVTNVGPTYVSLVWSAADDDPG